MILKFILIFSRTNTMFKCEDQFMEVIT